MDPRRCWKGLETTAKCPLCSETLKDPKTLPCLHSFCLLCLDNLARIERRQHQDEISCPICQTSISIPEENTFSNLPTSFHLDQVQEILTVPTGNQTVEMCLTCNEGKTAISEMLRDPKSFPCLHSFRLLCLDNLSQIERRRHQDEISCPIFQTSIPIPEANTIIDLPTSFHLDRFKEVLTLSNENQMAKTCLT